jgi:hypothetical protein
MPFPPFVTALSQDVQTKLQTIVKPKFDAYFSFTSSGSGTSPRAVPDPLGQPWFVYPNQSMIPDITFLWSLFSDVYQVLGGSAQLARFVKADADLKSDFYRIIEGSSPSDPDGSFWHFPRGQVPLHEATDAELEYVLKTLRNGFAHSHWLYENLSAFDYWTRLGWQTAGSPPSFDLRNRPQKNYMTYIADARHWKPESFWSMNDLRIVVTPSHVLRYHLHLFLNFVLNGSRTNVFQQ